MTELTALVALFSTEVLPLRAIASAEFKASFVA
jgi:hypothetical protein